MYQVSNAWKQAHTKNILPQSELIITMDLKSPVGITVATNGEHALSNTQNMLDLKPIGKTPTLEPNQWELDKNVVLGDYGYISSAISQADGSFATYPVLTFTLAEATAIPNYLYIKWGVDDYATDFNVTINNGGVEMLNQDFTGNTLNEVLVPTSVTADEIVLTIKAWVFQNTRARVNGFSVGTLLTMTSEQINTFTQTQELDLNSFSLPINKIQFSIIDKDKYFYPVGNQNLTQFLYKNLPITVTYGYYINGAYEMIPCGKYYLTGWTNTTYNGIASFEAKDAGVFLGGTFDITQLGTVPYTTTPYALAVEALRQGGVADYIISNDLQNYTVTIDTETGYTCGEMLQLCANACSGTMYYDRNGALNIETGVLDADHSEVLNITEFIQFRESEITLLDELKSVDVNEGLGSYVVQTDGLTQEVVNPLIETQAQANEVAEWVADVLDKRYTFQGEFRPDLSMDLLDGAYIESNGENNYTLLIGLTFLYQNGWFQGKYVGREAIAHITPPPEPLWKWVYKTTDPNQGMVISIYTKEAVSIGHMTMDGAIIKTYTLPALETATTQTITIDPIGETTQLWTDFESTDAVFSSGTFTPRLTFMTTCDLFSCIKWGNCFYWKYDGGNGGPTELNYLSIPYDITVNGTSAVDTSMFILGDTTNMSWKNATANTPQKLSCAYGVNHLSSVIGVTTSGGLYILDDVVVGSISSVSNIVVPSSAISLPSSLIQHTFQSFTMDDLSPITVFPDSCISSAMGVTGTITISPGVKKLEYQALNISSGGITVTFKMPNNQYVMTPALAVFGGLAYNKTSRSWTIKTDNPCIASFDWSHDNITATIKNLNGVAYGTTATGTASFTGKVLNITADVDSVMGGYNLAGAMVGTPAYDELPVPLVVGANDLSSFIDGLGNIKTFFLVVLYDSNNSILPIRIMVTYDPGA